MSILSRIAKALQSIFTSAAKAAARSTGFEKRHSKLGGEGFVQALVFACLEHPSPTLDQIAQTAASAGFPVSDRAIDPRFTPEAAETLQLVLQDAVNHVIAADPVDVALLNRFPAGVFIQDSTFVTLPQQLQDLWPGFGGNTKTADVDSFRPNNSLAAIKFQVRLNLNTGQLFGPFPTPARLSDQRCLFCDLPLPEGALRIADLGYYNLEEFRALGDSGCYWLSRWQRPTVVFTAGEGQLQRRNLHCWLCGQPSDVLAVDQEVVLGETHLLPGRLVAWRVPEAEAEQRRRRLRGEANKEGKQPTQAMLDLCSWSIFLTNVPVEMASVEEISVLARSRWQMELLFKQWKLDLQAGKSRSEKPERVLCELLAVMIAAVIEHWSIVASCWGKAMRSLRKAGSSVRSMARTLAASLSEEERLVWALESIQRSLESAAKINKSRKKPRTWQLLDAPTLFGQILAKPSPSSSRS